MTTEQLYDIYLQHPIVTTDSRNCPEGSIFFALKGESFNGNRFAHAALEKGCAYAVVDEVCDSVEGQEYEDRIILVDDVLHALQQLARMHRDHFRGPVIQITGTNGKTTTKELIAAVLSQRYHVLYTQGNLNNHIGVPLTLLRLTAGHDIAVIETGANHPGEIKALAEIVNPDCGLITNVGMAHIEGFGSFEGVIRTKGELYDYLRSKEKVSGSKFKVSNSQSQISNFKFPFVFLHADNPHLGKITQGLAAITYGSPASSPALTGEVVECAPFLKLRWYVKAGTPTPSPQAVLPLWQRESLQAVGQGATESDYLSHTVQTHLIGAYNIDNALAAVSVGLCFGVEPEQIDKALEAYEPHNNRSEMRKTKSNTLIIDAYNANPSSMGAALSNFATMPAPEGMQKMLILGDMKELGAVSEQEHSKVVEKIKEMVQPQPQISNFKFQTSNLTPQHVWLVGPNFKSLNPPFPTFNDVEEVKEHLRQHPVEGKLILIKGSNSTHLYQLPDNL